MENIIAKCKFQVRQFEFRKFSMIRRLFSQPHKKGCLHQIKSQSIVVKLPIRFDPQFAVDILTMLRHCGSAYAK